MATCQQTSVRRGFAAAVRSNIFLMGTNLRPNRTTKLSISRSLCLNQLKFVELSAMEEPNKFGHWQKISILGSGGFGVVSLWKNEETQETIAVKKCRWNIPENIPAKQKERWTKEVEIMRNIRHNNIVSAKNLPEDLEDNLLKFNHSKLPLLPMEYCVKGNLRHALSQAQNAVGLPEVEVRFVLKDLLSAISYLHNLKITHRDIKPENIVLQICDTRPTKTLYKLIDLGYAKELDSEIASFVGTLQYLAPEIFLQKPYTRNVDYWSLGIVVFEVICGVHPFLSKISPIQRFKHLEKKSDNDIYITTSQSGEIIYSSEILKENHISYCLKIHLEKWLRIVLRYNPMERGQTDSNKDIFEELSDILNKYIICVFSVYNYSFYYYDITENTLLTELQSLIEKDTGIIISEQLLLTDNIYYEDNEDRRVIDYIEEKNALVMLFKKDEFIKQSGVTLPIFVKNLLKTDKTYAWKSLYVQMVYAVHFIHQETKLMESLKRSYYAKFDYIQNLFKKEATIYSEMKATAKKLLTEIEIYRDINDEIKNMYMDKSNLASVKNIKNNLWRCRDLIDNVNTASCRHAKLLRSEDILTEASVKIEDSFNKSESNDLYSKGLACLAINKEKAAVMSEPIRRVLNNTLMIRYEVHTNTFMKQYVIGTFQSIREIHRLIKWMAALKGQIEEVAVEMRTNQLNLLKGFAKSGGTQSISDDIEINDIPVDLLTSCNVDLRYNFQEVMTQLLSLHKSNVEELQSFEICIESAV